MAKNYTGFIKDDGSIAQIHIHFDITIIFFRLAGKPASLTADATYHFLQHFYYLLFIRVLHLVKYVRSC